jgi:hypothetical protein
MPRFWKTVIFGMAIWTVGIVWGAYLHNAPTWAAFAVPLVVGVLMGFGAVYVSESR